MTTGLNAKKVVLGVMALLLAGVIGYSLRGRTVVKSTTTRTSPTTTVKTSTQSSSSSTSVSNDYKYSYLKDQCVSGLQSYGTSVRNKAEAMASKIRAEVAAAGNNPDTSRYQAEINQLLDYVKTMQQNMKTLQTCITQVDQKHDFSASELSGINAAIAASKQ